MRFDISPTVTQAVLSCLRFSACLFISSCESDAHIFPELKFASTWILLQSLSTSSLLRAEGLCKAMVNALKRPASIYEGERRSQTFGVPVNMTMMSLKNQCRFSLQLGHWAPGRSYWLLISGEHHSKQASSLPHNLQLEMCRPEDRNQRWCRFLSSWGVDSGPPRPQAW